MAARQIIRIAQAHPMSRNDAFTAFSINDQNLGSDIDPFLQLDHFFMKQPTFPAHPHAGFSAVTYLFEDSEGSFFNRDSQGDSSLIHPGDLHWTQAGRGIIHEETPTKPGQLCHGVQIFVNLSAANKFTFPQAFHINAADIPIFSTPEQGRVRVVVGSAFGLSSPLTEILTPVTLLDVSLSAHTTIIHEIDAEQNAFVLVIQGQGSFGVPGRSLHVHQAGLCERTNSGLQVQTTDQSVQYLLCAGLPLSEPIYAQGPFVMNSAEQIQQVYADYKSGKMGHLV
ncbi:pirin family protein [Aetokthonos hydrillicola Thurmond2011]|jgi:hypothetical protein|uniref:Pirin family protein n=3 Tax=Aetokthonos TaxID=1550243 RepID=A0AAP5I9A7_9CYAN|nr:pirin-like C-terminal cupin domain-containing protein [Aetokthonos hydrillicola]MBO3461457.1 pirin family protein [Aetokthonos hydrillicola CCALA 1050]MBW4588799.1 pirin family protein [Aetokthonos hydrillicola CCALA 1050]MDR9897337.1 pirin family protein [Aetokthonos hydrillicola Thurmond2011]